MNHLRKTIALTIVGAALVSPFAFAQDRHDDHHDDRHDNHHYVEHKEWRKGYHMRHEDWDRGERIDYRRYHLHAPPRGYEWRAVDGNFVLAAAATGIVASVIAASGGY